jgi:cell division protein FtsQ
MHERFRARRQAVADAGRRRRRRLGGSVVALAAIAGLAAAAVASPLFAVTEVRITGAAGEQAEQVRAAAAFGEQPNLLLADIEGAARRVEVLPWVRSAAVTRVPPSTLEVAVRVREPVAVVRLADASWLVDAGGVLIGGGLREGLVHVEAPGAALPSVGEVIGDPGIASALAVHEGLAPELRGRVLRYDARPGTPLRFELALEGEARTWVRVGDASAVEAKSAAIELLLARGAADSRDLTRWELDVRVPELPVLRPLT